MKSTTTIKDAKEQLSKLIDELNKYDENTECRLYFDNYWYEGYHPNCNILADFSVEPEFYKNSKKPVGVYIANIRRNK